MTSYVIQKKNILLPSFILAKVGLVIMVHTTIAWLLCALTEYIKNLLRKTTQSLKNHQTQENTVQKYHHSILFLNHATDTPYKMASRIERYPSHPRQSTVLQETLAIRRFSNGTPVA